MWNFCSFYLSAVSCNSFCNLGSKDAKGEVEMDDSDYSSDYHPPRNRTSDLEDRIDDLESKVNDLENAMRNSGGSGCMGYIVFILLIAVFYLYTRFVW